MRRIAVPVLLLLLVAGCATPGMMQGRVSAQSYKPIPKGATFRVIGSSDISLTEKLIVRLLKEHMQRQGFVLVDDREEAVLTVLYRYAIVPGQIEVTSSVDMLSNPRQLLFRENHDPKTFEVFILDAQATARAGKPVMFWQGELISSGPNSDIGSAAGLYLQELFREFGRVVQNRPFMAPYIPGWQTASGSGEAQEEE